MVLEGVHLVRLLQLLLGGSRSDLVGMLVLSQKRGRGPRQTYTEGVVEFGLLNHDV